MPYVENNGVKIYYETIGKGPPLFLHHGLTGSLTGFKIYGYTETLKHKHKLIQIDARGHGKSSKPYNPESYKLKTIVNDIVTILDTLNIDKTHFFGYSWGGRIGLATAKYAPNRFKSLIIGGMGAWESDSPKQIKRNQTMINNYKRGIDAYIAESEKQGILMTSERRKQLRSNDYKALTAVRLVQEHIGFSAFLPDVDIPCLVYAGDLDYWHMFAKDTAESIKGAEFLSLPGLDHGEGLHRSDLVLPHITNFLDKL